MTIYHSTQICGTDSKITVYDNKSGTVFVTIGDVGQNIVMEAQHVRQLAAALDAFEAQAAEVSV